MWKKACTRDRNDENLRHKEPYMAFWKGWHSLDSLVIHWRMVSTRTTWYLKKCWSECWNWIDKENHLEHYYSNLGKTRQILKKNSSEHGRKRMEVKEFWASEITVPWWFTITSKVRGRSRQKSRGENQGLILTPGERRHFWGRERKKKRIRIINKLKFENRKICEGHDSEFVLEMICGLSR